MHFDGWHSHGFSHRLHHAPKGHDTGQRNYVLGISNLSSRKEATERQQNVFDKCTEELGLTLEQAAFIIGCALSPGNENCSKIMGFKRDEVSRDYVEYNRKTEEQREQTLGLLAVDRTLISE